RNPYGLRFLLPPLHWITHVEGVVGSGGRISHGGQVSAHADGVHVREKEEPVSAQEVLDVGPAIGNDELDAGLAKQPIEKRGIEGLPHAVIHPRPLSVSATGMYSRPTKPLYSSRSSSRRNWPTG